MTTRTLRRVRPVMLVGAGTLLAALLPGLARGADAPFVAGSGNAYAQVVRVGPTESRLSLAPILGVSLSDYTDVVARAESEAADLAAIGVSSPCTDANVPRLRTTSDDARAAQGKEEFVAGGQGGNGVGELFVRATKDPVGEARVRVARFVIPGLLTINGGESHTTSGLVTRADGTKVRRSTAETSISSVVFGPVELTGLHWTAVQETDAQQHRTVTGGFRVSQVKIAGMPLPDPAQDLNAVLGPINAALAPTGFAIAPPAFDPAGGVATVSPLAIQIVDSPLGRQFLGPVLGAVQPIREPLTAQLIQLLKQPSTLTPGNPNDCSQTTIPDLSVGVLVADIGLGLAAGSSELHLELGGVNAYTEGQVFQNPFNFTLGAPHLTAPETKTITTFGTPGTPGSAGTQASTGTTTGQLAAAAPPSQRTVPGGRGGAAVAVGLAGIAAALGLAAADWWRMRRSRALAG